MVDVLYSLVDVNERLNQLIFDPFYVLNLDMTMKSSYDDTFSISDKVLDRICKNVLPRIHHHVNKLTVEPHSLKYILRNFNIYPQLFSLSFINFQEEILYQYLTGDSSLHRLLTEQITHLNILIQNEIIPTFFETLSDVFILILSSCKRLISLDFFQLFPDQMWSGNIFTLPSTSYTSLTLTQLKINVKTFHACLYLLDGRLHNLSTLIINVSNISRTLSNIDKIIVILLILFSLWQKIPKLKYFSLTSLDDTYNYDDEIIPLLHRMMNLEELMLCLSIIRVDLPYIDGTHLHEEIQSHMPRLNKLIFSINTTIVKNNININFPSNEDIQRTFIERGYQQVGSYVDSTVQEGEGRCHVYSLPYQFESFLHLNNSFQGGTFNKVWYLTMTDDRPFEHEFFKIMSQNFPFLKTLSICNKKPQKNKQHSSTLITFPHLTALNLNLAHMNYGKQFLLEQNTYLPCLSILKIRYKTLTKITKNFTNNAARLNCNKLRYLHMNGFDHLPSNFHHYFPSLKSYFGYIFI
ncbi:unnamed protein product [Rotaria sp. Silwood2]|nr:unnamed protein product [Rotaria sp. Silwood2]